jgi:hypothetical protein
VGRLRLNAAHWQISATLINNLPMRALHSGMRANGARQRQPQIRRPRRHQHSQRSRRHTRRPLRQKQFRRHRRPRSITTTWASSTMSGILSTPTAEGADGMAPATPGTMAMPTAATVAPLIRRRTARRSSDVITLLRSTILRWKTLAKQRNLNLRYSNWKVSRVDFRLAGSLEWQVAQREGPGPLERQLRPGESAGCLQGRSREPSER